jgi:hypothetical protein
MLRNYIVLLPLLCAGCVIWWEDSPNSRDSGYNSVNYDMWFEDVEVYCEYDPMGPGSLWTLTAQPTTVWGYDEIDEVYVDILGSYAYTYVNSFRLTPGAYGVWSYSFYNYGAHGDSYYCGSTYDFEFTAYDYYDNAVSTWYYW